MKSYLDYGAFTPIQVAAAAALNGPQDCVDEIRAHLQGAPRRAGGGPGARRLGHPSAAGLDVRLGADAASSSAARHAGVLQAADRRRPRSRSRPGLGFGEYGEGYVRVGLVENEHRIRQALRNVSSFLAGVTTQPRPRAGRRRARCSMSKRRWRSRVAGLGTVGAGLLKFLPTTPTSSPAGARPPIVVTRRLRARPRPRPRLRLSAPALVRRSGGAGRRSRQSTCSSS